MRSCGLLRRSKAGRIVLSPFPLLPVTFHPRMSRASSLQGRPGGEQARSGT